MEQQTGSKLGKDYVKAIYCHPAYLTYIQSTLCSVLGWMKHKRIKIAGRNINNLRYADGITLGLKLNIQIMASDPITSWQIDGETVETVADFIFLGSKVTVDGDCSHEIKRRILLGRKVMTNIDSIFKIRDITLPKKVPSS